MPCSKSIPWSRRSHRIPCRKPPGLSRFAERRTEGVMSIDYIMVFGIALLFFSTITYTAFDRQDAARDQAAFHEYKSIADRFVFHIEEVIRYAGMNRDED